MNTKPTETPTRPRAIYLDLDGVLANFDDAICEFHERPYLAGRNWSQTEATNIGDVLDMTSSVLCKGLSDEWWGDAVCSYPWARWFVSASASVAAEMGAELFFLSSPAGGGCESATGKIKWIYELFGTDYERQLILCPTEHKWRILQPSDMIVDDNPKVISDARLKAHCAHAWLFPTPFNSRFSDDAWHARYVTSVDQMMKFLGAFQRGMMFELIENGNDLQEEDGDGELCSPS